MEVGEEQLEIVVRPAVDADLAGIAVVARAHGFAEADSGVDERYLSFIETHGRLVVAAIGDDVVAFGGAVDAGGVRLVSDLFVLDAFRVGGSGRGCWRRWSTVQTRS